MKLINPISTGGVFCLPLKNNLLYLHMTNDEKAELYNQIMFEYTKVQNQISSIKGESINLNEQQLSKIRELENRLRYLMDRISRL